MLVSEEVRNGQDKDIDRLFVDAKADIVQVLSSPYLKRIVRPYHLSLLQERCVIAKTRQEYAEGILEHTRSGSKQEPDRDAVGSAQKDSSSSTGVYIRNWDDMEGDQILINIEELRMQCERNGTPLDFELRVTIAEELSHALGVSKTIPFARLSGKSEYYQPFNTKELKLKEMQNIAKVDVKAVDIVVKSRGFRYGFFNEETNEPIIMGAVHYAVEETREAILKSLLLILHYGKKGGDGDLFSVVRVGYGYLMGVLRENRFGAFPDIEDSLEFLRAAYPGFGVDKAASVRGLRMTLRLMGEEDVDGFVTKVSRKEDNTFNQAFNKMNDRVHTRLKRS